jgi:hypothetical protein
MNLQLKNRKKDPENKLNKAPENNLFSGAFQMPFSLL